MPDASREEEDNAATGLKPHPSKNGAVPVKLLKIEHVWHQVFVISLLPTTSGQGF